MRHEQDREVGVFPELQQLFLHLPAGERVERGERLVHEQDVGLHGHAACNGHALLHAARQHVRIGVLEPIELHLTDVLAGDVLRLRLRLASTAVHERKRDVLLDCLPGQQLIEFLEHHDPVRSRLGDGASLE